MIPVYDVGVIIYFILFDMLSDASGQTCENGSTLVIYNYHISTGWVKKLDSLISQNTLKKGL